MKREKKKGEGGRAQERRRTRPSTRKGALFVAQEKRLCVQRGGPLYGTLFSRGKGEGFQGRKLK